MRRVSGVSVLRDAFLEALDELAAERVRLQRALHDAASAWMLVGEHVSRGGSVQEITTLVDPAELRGRVSDALDGWERARHRAQQLVYRLSALDGESITDISRRWGVSRQLVSRMLNEHGP
jgi:hypothetical protein